MAFTFFVETISASFVSVLTPNAKSGLNFRRRKKRNLPDTGVRRQDESKENGVQLSFLG